MKKWEKIQNACKSREIIGILGIIVSIIIGGICDWNVLIEGNILISIDDLESLSLRILQKQASVGIILRLGCSIYNCFTRRYCLEKRCYTGVFA